MSPLAHLHARPRGVCRACTTANKLEVTAPYANYCWVVFPLFGCNARYEVLSHFAFHMGMTFAQKEVRAFHGKPA